MQNTKQHWLTVISIGNTKVAASSISETILIANMRTSSWYRQFVELKHKKECMKYVYLKNRGSSRFQIFDWNFRVERPQVSLFHKAEPHYHTMLMSLCSKAQYGWGGGGVRVPQYSIPQRTTIFLSKSFKWHFKLPFTLLQFLSFPSTIVQLNRLFSDVIESREFLVFQFREK